MANLEITAETKLRIKEENKNDITDKEITLEYIGDQQFREKGVLAQSAASVAIGFSPMSAAESIYFTPEHDMTLRLITAAASAEFGVGSGATFQLTRSPSNKIISLEATNQIGIQTNSYDLIVTD